MSSIPPFNLPSDPAKKIVLREATVTDAMDFAEIDERHEEEVTTLFLNRVQVATPPLDSALWTAEDRRLALYWYWLHTTKETTVLLSYDCDFCGKTHQWALDLKELADGYRPIEGAPKRSFEFGAVTLHAHPLLGGDMEALELMAMDVEAARDACGPESREHRRARNALRLERFIRCLAGPDDLDGAREFVMGLPASDFVELANLVDGKLSEMRHGLATAYDDGQVFLLTPPHSCSEGKEGKTRLRMPFRNIDYIPGLQ